MHIYLEGKRTVGTTGLAGGEKRKTSVRKQFSMKPEAATSLLALARREVAVVHTDAQNRRGLNMGDRDCAVLLTGDMHFRGVKLLRGYCQVIAGFLRARTWAQVIETKGVTATG